MTDAPPRPTQHAADLRNYAVVTGAYWADTIADGAIRLLVLFYFFERGYSPLAVASLFIFYEVFGVVTNLVGGWLAARLGLRFTLVAGLGTQLLALSMLAIAPESLLVVAYVMVAQAFSGIAKDLTKMSAKSAIKLIVPADASGQLYRWVALLTGSKNALKGVGFFVGGLLLTTTSFRTALLVLMGLVLTALLVVLVMMRGDARAARPEGALSRDVLPQPRGQRARGRADLPLRRARRVVRRRGAGLPAHGARLELLAGGHVPRRVGDRLRRRAGQRAALRPRPRRSHGDVAGVHARAAAGGHRRRAGRGRRRRRRARRRLDRRSASCSR